MISHSSSFYKVSTGYFYSFFAILCIVFFYFLVKPNGVDWNYYSNVSPKYELFYFRREIISWFVIDVFNDYDKSGILVASFISSLLMVATYKATLQLSKDKTIAYLTTIFLLFSNFYLLLSVNGLRQGISLAIFLFAFQNFLKRKYLYTMIFFLASLFSHNSIIILSPVFLIRLVPNSLFFIGTMLMPFLGQLIINIALKNNNASPTQNKEIFLVLTISILLLAFLHLFSNKYKQNSLLTSTQFKLIFLYVFLSLTAFYFSSAIYERMIYTSIPILIILSTYFLNSYRPRWLFFLLYFLLILASSFYSLTHPSVVNNFINLTIL